MELMEETRHGRSRPVCIIDTTLRDGEQAPGVCFDRETKHSLAVALDRAGVDELEVGTPVMGPEVQEDIRGLAHLGLEARLSVWCRAHDADLAAAVDCHTSGVHFSFPVSQIHLSALGKDGTWVLARMESLVAAARRYFDYVTIGAQDVTRTDLNFLLTFAAQAAALGVDRLRLADTVGLGRPTVIMDLVSALKAGVPGLKLDFHGHNDLGMATANALSALEAGAEAVSVTVNGMGERAGNTALEQMVMALRLHPDLHCRVEAADLMALCGLTATAAGRSIHPAQPVVGDQAFVHESGIHCQAMFRDDRAYEPFPPQLAGRNDRRFVLGAHSGTASIRRLLGQAGICASAGQARALRPLLMGLARPEPGTPH